MTAVLRSLAGAGVIAGTFLIYALIVTGVGILFRRMFGRTIADFEDLYLAFWAGFSVIIGILLLWNFFLPVTAAAAVVIALVGGAGLASLRPNQLGWSAARFGRPRWWLPAIFILTVWLCNQAAAPFTDWDGALYHLQGVLWAKEYPVVPGLANLYGPLAFNNSSFLFFALLDSGPWRGQAFHVANGLLVWVALVGAITAGARIARNPSRSSTRTDLFSFATLGAVVSLIGRVATYNTDVPMTLVVLVAMTTIYSVVMREDLDREEEAYRVVLVALLLAAAVALKMSAGPLAAVGLSLFAGWWVRSQRPEPGLRAKAATWAAVVVLIFAGAWVVRGIILSGYPLFPLSMAGLPVDWRAPVEHARAEVANIAFTESGFSFTLGQAWLRQVTIGSPFEVFVPAWIGLVGLGLWLSGRGRDRPFDQRSGWWIAIPLLVSIAAWLRVAPSPRYATGFFWSLAALTVSQSVSVARRVTGAEGRIIAARLTTWLVAAAVGVVGLALVGARRHGSIGRVEQALIVAGVGWVACAGLIWVARAWSTRGRLVSADWPTRAAIRGLLALGLSPIVVLPALRVLRREVASDPGSVGDRGWVRPGPDRLFGRVAEEPSVVRVTTNSGLVLNVPARTGPNEAPGKCWATPIPCTSNPAPNLRLRTPGRMAGGFAVDGGWQMRDWPYYWRPDFLEKWRARR